MCYNLTGYNNSVVIYTQVDYPGAAHGAVFHRPGPTGRLPVLHVSLCHQGPAAQGAPQV